MGKVRTFGMAIAAMALATQPVLAGEEKSEPQFVCPGGAAVYQNGVCVAVDEGKLTAARSLANTIYPLDLQLHSSQVAFKNEFHKSLAQSSELQAMEMETPGLIAFLEGRILDFLTSEFTAAYPSYIALIAPIYANNMSIAEMQEVENFFKGPAGRKFLTEMANNPTVMDEWVNCIPDGDANCVSAESLRASGGQSGAKAAAKMSRKDGESLVAFMETAGWKAYQRAAPKIQGAIGPWISNFSSIILEKMPNVLYQAMADWDDIQEEKKKS